MFEKAVVMAHLTLTCPQCRKRRVYVPLDGLTLYYRCEEHGVLLLKPLQPAPVEEAVSDAARQQLSQPMREWNAA